MSAGPSVISGSCINHGPWCGVGENAAAASLSLQQTTERGWGGGEFWRRWEGKLIGSCKTRDLRAQLDACWQLASLFLLKLCNIRQTGYSRD